MDHRRLRSIVDRLLGFHYAEYRQGDLVNGVRTAAKECGFDDPGKFLDHLESPGCPPSLPDALVRQLAIGETYFFRHKDQFSFLETTILPGLIQSRRKAAEAAGTKPVLRIWSAACSTGEETWSLAITVRRILPDFKDWKIVIIGTDVNQTALRAARRSEYGEWSFRSVSREIRQMYFEEIEGKLWRVRKESLPQVTFSEFNFFEHGVRIPGAENLPFDIILCRNVLYYFSNERVRTLLDLIASHMAEDGWFIVGPSESFAVSSGGFIPAGSGSVTVFRRPGSQAEAMSRDRQGGITESHRNQEGRSTGGRELYTRSLSSKISGQTLFTLPARPEVLPGMPDMPKISGNAPSPVRNRMDAPPNPVAPVQEQYPGTQESPLNKAARLADSGKYVEARKLCNEAIAGDRTDPDARYLSGLIHLGMNDRIAAQADFRKTLYLASGHIMAHFTLASLESENGNTKAAGRLLDECMELLKTKNGSDMVPWSGGLTASTIMRSVMQMKSGGLKARRSDAS